MGTSHGAYKFTRKPDGNILSMQVVEAIHTRLPNIHLVMHGSSSVPQELQDHFNAYGGAMRQTYGVPVEQIVRGIKHGVRKVDTDCRIAMTAELRRVAQQTPDEFNPRKIPEARVGSQAGRLPAAVRAIRYRRKCIEDQVLANVRYGKALCVSQPQPPN